MNEKHTNVWACHCNQCRKQTSSPFFIVHSGGEETFTFEGEEFISRFKSSEKATRGFCSNCGTILFWELNESHCYSFNAELFPEQRPEYKIVREVYLKDKPDYYSLKI
jgi:hypothetical protein